MGAIFSKAQPDPSPSLLEKPWRRMEWETVEALRSFLREYKPPRGLKHIRILVYGPVGAGKSSTISSMQTALRGLSGILATGNAVTDTEESFTATYKTHRFSNGKFPPEFFNFVFSDIMGVESGEGIRPGDIHLALKGHVKEGYKFDSQSNIKEDSDYYIEEPSPEDRVHLLVCILNANSPDMSQAINKKIRDIRKAASALGIPEVGILTNIDNTCDEIEENLEKVFRSKTLQNTMKTLSLKFGIPVNAMFPVINYSDGDLDRNTALDTMLLTALKYIVFYANDFVNGMLQSPSFSPAESE